MKKEHEEKLIIPVERKDLNAYVGEMLIQLIREHRELEDHENCNITLGLFRAPIEKLLENERGLTEEEKRLFF